MKKLTLLMLLYMGVATAQTFNFDCEDMSFVKTFGSGSVTETIDNGILTISAIPDEDHSFIGYRELINGEFFIRTDPGLVIPTEGAYDRALEAHFRRTIADVETLTAVYRGETYTSSDVIDIIPFGGTLRLTTTRYEGISSLALEIKVGSSYYISGNSMYDYCSSIDLETPCGGEIQNFYINQPNLGGSYVASVFARGGPIDRNIIRTTFDRTPYERDGWDLFALTDGSALHYYLSSDDNIGISQTDSDVFVARWFSNLAVEFEDTTFDEVAEVVLEEHAAIISSTLYAQVNGSDELQTVYGQDTTAEITVSGSYTSPYLPSLQTRYELWLLKTNGEPQLKVGGGRDPMFTITATQAFASHELKRFRVKSIVEGFLTTWSNDITISFQ